MTVEELIRALGDDIGDPEEETFFLFSQQIPSQDLGFVDSQAPTLQLTVAGRDLVIQQSPSLLTSNRAGGTTGAVVWKVSPFFAEWIASPTSVLFRHAVLGSESVVLELGCGISGLVGLALAPRVGRYIATDQSYVMKLLRQNLDENGKSEQLPKTRKPRNRTSTISRQSIPAKPSIETISLDWELSSLDSLPVMFTANAKAIAVTVDAVLACDCIYNEALVDPLVQTCAEICRLRIDSNPECPTMCIVAQQLRSPTVFEAWLVSFHRLFRVWRFSDDMLTDDLKSNSGFVVHLGILRT